MAGVLRVVYFLALSGILVAFGVTLITTVYQGPSNDIGGGFASAFADGAEQNYNRNLGAIFGLLGSATMGLAILGFQSSLNTLRSGLLLGGLLLFYTGLGFSSSGSDEGLAAFWSLGALCVLFVGAYYLDDGMPALVSWIGKRSVP
jgi:hypothetical protein